ncbi:MAG: hypothetical protein ACYDEJ_13920 [Desulfitobacteriaceae bacterium]
MLVLERSTSKNSHYFTHQIIQYANQHDYFFNSSLFRGWIRLKFKLPENKNYQLLVSIHHYGFEDSTIAIGAFMEIITKFEKPKKEFRKSQNIRSNDKGEIYTALPLEIKPLTISAEREIKDLESSIKSFLKDVVTIALAHIASDI